MHLTNLHVRQFRNYERLKLSCHPQVNVFLGDNAQGKTNVLEAIYVLALAKSHRTAKDEELIRWGEPFARIFGEIKTKHSDLSMELIISTQGKKGKVNGLEQKKLSDYIGSYNVVMFAPEDLSLVKGSPSVRRRFLDMELGQMSRVYLHHLSEYNKILRQRNHLLRTLRNEGGAQTMLDVLTEQLIMSAAEVTSRRFLFISRLQTWAQKIHYGISRGKEELTVRYVPSVHVSEEMNMSKIVEVYYEHFKRLRQKEIERGMTLFGPQRDDIGLFVNERNIQKYGSQGQQRTTALALKLAELELMHAEVGEYPILLLDDVLSELDTFRQSHLLQTIKDRVQTFITTTSIDRIDDDMLTDAQIYNVDSGNIYT